MWYVAATLLGVLIGVWAADPTRFRRVKQQQQQQAEPTPSAAAPTTADSDVDIQLANLLNYMVPGKRQIGLRDEQD